MELFDLNANIRKTKGNGPARALRRSGRLPGVFYGPGTEPVLLSIDNKELTQILKKENVGQVIINLTILDDTENTRTAMIKELQTDPVSRKFIHVDFYEIDMKRKVRTFVPVIVKGKSPGVERGGLLQIIRRELEVLALPLVVPDSIELDITSLDIGDSIHVEEIQLEGDIEIVADVNYTVVTVVSPKVEKEPVEEEEEVEGEEAEEAGEEEAAESPETE